MKTIIKLILRYEKWKEKRKNDKKCAEESYDDELQNRILVPVAKLKIQEAILRLKETLTFKYYIQLLEEVGIPGREVYPFKGELSGKVRGYSDS